MSTDTALTLARMARAALEAESKSLNERINELKAENVRLRGEIKAAIAGLTPDANDPDVYINDRAVREFLRKALEAKR